MSRDAKMSAHDIDEERIALRSPDGSGMTDHPEEKASNPKPQAEAERGRNRPVEDGHGAGRTAEQDGFG
jgi:hypothetical protein